MEAYVEQQLAHIAAQRARQFQETTAVLYRKWVETQRKGNLYYHSLIFDFD